MGTRGTGGFLRCETLRYIAKPPQKLDLDRSQFRWPGCLRRFEVKFEGLLEVRERFFFGLALAGDVNLQARRYVPVTLTPDSRGKGSFHARILSQDDSGCR